MFKKFTFFALVAVLAASCSKSETLVPVNAQGNALYTNSSVGSSFQLNTSWLTAEEVAF